MKVKVSELTGMALRYAVAMADDWNGSRTHSNVPVMIQVQGYRPDLLWEQGGPIIERKRIMLIPQSNLRGEPLPVWTASFDGYPNPYWAGPTPLVAAMRCFVASKLGDEVDIPEELLP